MIHYKKLIPTLCLIASFTIIACNKNDVKKEAVNTSSAHIQWASITDWKFKTANEVASYQTVLQDSTITESVISNGLVLVYSKDGNNIRGLPFLEQKGRDNIEWYYQVEQGNIVVAAASADKFAFDKNQALSYLVFSPNELENIQKKGYPKYQLIDLSLEQILKLKK